MTSIVRVAREHPLTTYKICLRSRCPPVPSRLVDSIPDWVVAQEEPRQGNCTEGLLWHDGSKTTLIVLSRILPTQKVGP